MEEWIAASTPQRIESAPTLILTVEQFDEVSVRARFNFFDYNFFFSKSTRSSSNLSSAL